MQRSRESGQESFFDERFQTYKVAWELNELEESAKSFTVDCIKFYKSLILKNEILFAKKIEENLNFSWHIMNTANGWYVNSLNSDWTFNQEEQKFCINHLSAARNELSQLIWWIGMIEQQGDIVENQLLKELDLKIFKLLEKSKEINLYFKWFKPNKTSKEKEERTDFENFSSMISKNEAIFQCIREDKEYDNEGNLVDEIHVEIAETLFVFDKKSGEYKLCFSNQ